MTRRLDAATYSRIREVIASHVGRERAIHAREILAILRAAGTPTHSRRVSECIQQMQAEGEAVLSTSTHGIWIADSYDELAADLSETRKRIAALRLKEHRLIEACQRRIQTSIAGVSP